MFFWSKGMIIWSPELDDEAIRWRDIASELTESYFSPIAAEIDENQRYPEEHLPHLLSSGITGMFLPKEYGGAGASLVAVCSVAESIATGCASTAAILAALTLGAFPVLIGGNKKQKHDLLGALAQQGHAVNFALSERNAGSDAAAIETVAVREGNN